MKKRCYNTAESLKYLGIKRRSFETHIMPNLAGKGVRIGNCVVFEVSDLDAAWESYKISVGSERPDALKGEYRWGDQKRPASSKRSRDTMLTKSTKESAFDGVALTILNQRKTG